MDDATQYWTFLTVAGEKIMSRQEMTAQQHFRTTIQPSLMDLAQDLPFPHRNIQRHLLKQHQSEQCQGVQQQQQVDAQPLVEAPSAEPFSVVDAQYTAIPEQATAVGVLTRQKASTAQITPISSQNPLAPKANVSSPTAAELCLRCSISHQISYACQQLADQFGANHGFTSLHLSTAVLHDECLLGQQRSHRRQPQNQSSYRSLATDIFETFNPERSSIKVWTVRRVRHDRSINEILLDHGVYLVSDWAILNDTTEPQLERILREFYSLSSGEIHQAILMLESYHVVYRGDRLKQQQSGRCCTPTAEQLDRISKYLEVLQAEEELSSISAPSPSDTLQQLQALAHCLRRHRIHSRGGKQVADSLDDPGTNYSAGAIPSSLEQADDDDSTDFISYYRQAFERCLDQAIQTAVEQRVAQLSKRKGERHKLFLKGLTLFHCQGQTMIEIAPQLGYERQDKVTYLLKLKNLRADIRHELLRLLRHQVVAIAQQFTNPERLRTIDQQLDAALEEQVSEMISEAERETSGERNGPLQSRFARHLCRYLDTRTS